MTRLLIVRHAQAATPDDLRLPGLDLPLLPDGIRQAQALAERLAPLRPAAVFASDARRARETAEIVAQRCGVPFILRAGLRELDFGEWAGRTYADVVVTDPAAADWFADPAVGAPPGGEDPANAASRVLAELGGLAGDTSGLVVVVGHAGSLRLALATTLGMPIAAAWRLRLDCAGLTVLDWTEAGPVLERLNDTAHLASLLGASEPASSSAPTSRDDRAGTETSSTVPGQNAVDGCDDGTNPMGADAEARRSSAGDGRAADEQATGGRATGGRDESRPYSGRRLNRAVGARFIAPVTDSAAPGSDDSIDPFEPPDPPDRQRSAQSEARQPANVSGDTGALPDANEPHDGVPRPRDRNAESQRPPSVTLILGGARSGKSTLAERLAAESGRPVLYLATSVPFDDEMRERIAAHRSDRPSGWRTVEEPLRIAAALRDLARPGDLVLLDCLTVWLSNWLLDGLGPDRDPDAPPAADWNVLESAALAETGALLADARARGVALILVSNEVGMGVVPAYPLGRRYRDALGRINQHAAAHADTVLLTIAGFPLDLKRLAATSHP